MVRLYFSLTLVLAISVANAGDGDGKNYAVIINGGANRDSNNQRYFENVRSMYDAFRSNGIASDHIMVLYGSGKVEDTNSPSNQPKFPEMGQPGQYGMGQTYATGSQSGGGSSSGPPSTQVMPSEPKMEPTRMGTIPSGDGTGVKSDKSNKTAAPSTITLDYLFSGEKRELDGGATSQNIKDKFRELRGKLKPGDNLTLYITDHGEQDPEGGSTVTLWGESMTVNQLGDLLREFPLTNQIRVVTNICYGGGLTELTSSNVCVFANQQANKMSQSESIDLDLYGQNFPYALKKKLDTDKDSKATYWDAHLYATNLDNPENIPTTSLEWFLLKNKNKILEGRYKKISPNQSVSGCSTHPDDAFKQIAGLLEDFERMKGKMGISTDGIPGSRHQYLKGRLEKTIQNLKGKDSAAILDDLDLRIQDLKASIAESAKNWDRLSPQEQAGKRQQAQLDAQQIKIKLAQIEKDRRKYEILNLELDLLKYGNDNMIKEYSSIRRCLEYAY
jgi:hypothetical protein